MAGTGQHTALALVIGAVVGIVLGWWVARATAPSAPAADDSPPTKSMGSRAGEAIGGFLKTVALIALVVVVFLILAMNIAHSPPHR